MPNEWKGPHVSLGWKDKTSSLCLSLSSFRPPLFFLSPPPLHPLTIIIILIILTHKHSENYQKKS